MQAAIDERHRQWIDTLGLQIMNCAESSDVDACLVAVGSTIYDHYGWDLSELASSGLDNPLPNDSDEVRLMSPPIIDNFGDPVVINLLHELDLSSDHHSNFEPAFVEALKNVRPREYLQALEFARDNDGELGLAEDALAEILEELVGAFRGYVFRPQRVALRWKRRERGKDERPSG